MTRLLMIDNYDSFTYMLCEVMLIVWPIRYRPRS